MMGIGKPLTVVKRRIVACKTGQFVAVYLQKAFELFYLVRIATVGPARDDVGHCGSHSRQ